MDLADLRSHINKPVVLRFHDGEEVAAILLGVDSRSEERSKPASNASCWRNTGPWLHGPALQTVQPR